MNRIFAPFFLLLACAWLRAANPSFQDFNANQFNVGGNKVAVKNGPLLTNINARTQLILDLGSPSIPSITFTNGTTNGIYAVDGGDFRMRFFDGSEVQFTGGGTYGGAVLAGNFLDYNLGTAEFHPDGTNWFLLTNLHVLSGYVNIPTAPASNTHAARLVDTLNVSNGLRADFAVMSNLFNAFTSYVAAFYLPKTNGVATGTVITNPVLFNTLLTNSGTGITRIQQQNAVTNDIVWLGIGSSNNLLRIKNNGSFTYTGADNTFVADIVRTITFTASGASAGAGMALIMNDNAISFDGGRAQIGTFSSGSGLVRVRNGLIITNSPAFDASASNAPAFQVVWQNGVQPGNDIVRFGRGITNDFVIKSNGLAIVPGVLLASNGIALGTNASAPLSVATNAFIIWGSNGSVSFFNFNGTNVAGPASP